MNYSRTVQPSGKASCALIVAYFVLMAPSSIWSGYVLSVLWAWFVVPTFELAQLTVPVAIGISLVVNYLTRQTLQQQQESKDPYYTFAYVVGQALLTPAFALGFGAIVRMFV